MSIFLRFCFFFSLVSFSVTCLDDDTPFLRSHFLWKGVLEGRIGAVRAGSLNSSAKEASDVQGSSSVEDTMNIDDVTKQCF